MLPRRLALAALLALGSLSGCVSMTEDTYDKLVPAAASMKVRPQGSILVRIFKEESELEVWKRGADGRYALLKTHPMCRWSGKLGPKKALGDRQAPEGFYRVTPALMNPNSKYHRSFNLGYPNPLEAALGYSGDALMVHGACSSAGCFAMTDKGVEEVFDEAMRAFGLGQSDFQVQAYPFRMTAEQMARHRSDPNYAFWKNLKLGYDIFDVTRREPEVAACGGRYVFDAKPVVASAELKPDAACPALRTNTAPEVAERRAKDEVKLRTLLESGQAGSELAYQDGGMHPQFREILGRLGADALAKTTSADAVQISRPDAALADPYSPPAPAPTQTGTR